MTDDELKQTIHETAKLAGKAAQTVELHVTECNGRDQVNSERFQRIDDRLTWQDRILWAILAVLGAAATGLAIVAWDIIKIKVLHGP